MKTHILFAALLAAILAGCGVDSTPQSGGASGASTQQENEKKAQ